MHTTKEILTLAVEIGDQMLRNGAEIYRVNETILKILKALNIEECDVYVLSNGIFASANESQEDACSVIRQVPLGSVNLEKIAELNQLARDICTLDCSIEDARGRLETCKKLPSYPGWIQALCCGVGSSGFSFLFGGSPIDAAFCFLIGTIEHYVLEFFKKRKVPRFISILIASLYITLMSFLVLYLARYVIPSLVVRQDKIIVGAIMPLVPGIALTTSIRDVYNGDYLSGTIHLVDALITAACIAVGACLPLYLSNYFGGVL